MINDRPGMLNQAIAAARSGDRQEAYKLLQALVALEPGNAQAWLWLAGVAENPAERRVALERVLSLDPTHARAQQGLRWLHERHPEIFDTPARDLDGTTYAVMEQDLRPPMNSVPAVRLVATNEEPQAPEAQTQPIETTVQPVVEASPPASEGDVPEPMPAMELAPDAVAVDLDLTESEPVEPEADPDPRPPDGDERYRCPFCGAWAAAVDSRCPRCQEPLIVAEDRRFGPRLARALQSLAWLLVSAGAIGASVWILGESQLVQSRGASASLQALGVQVAPAMLLPILSWTGLGLGAIALFGVVIALGLFRRWRAIYLLEYLVALIVLAVGVGAIVLAYPAYMAASQGQRAAGLSGLVGGTSLVVFALLILLLAVWSRHEFFPRRGRTYLEQQPASGAEHFRLGTRYRERGWRWAAAQELERAVEQEPNVLKYRKILAEVYSSMGNHARARDELRASLNLDPDTSPAARAGMLLEDTKRGRK